MFSILNVMNSSLLLSVFFRRCKVMGLLLCDCRNVQGSGLMKSKTMVHSEYS